MSGIVWAALKHSAKVSVLASHPLDMRCQTAAANSDRATPITAAIQCRTAGRRGGACRAAPAHPPLRAHPARVLRPARQVVAATNAAGFLVTAVTQSHKITDLTGTAAFAASAWATHAAAARWGRKRLPAPGSGVRGRAAASAYSWAQR